MFVPALFGIGADCDVHIDPSHAILFAVTVVRDGCAA